MSVDTCYALPWVVLPADRSCRWEGGGERTKREYLRFWIASREEGFRHQAIAKRSANAGDAICGGSEARRLEQLD